MYDNASVVYDARYSKVSFEGVVRTIKKNIMLRPITTIASTVAARR
jgi:hypothetical protein